MRNTTTQNTYQVRDSKGLYHDIPQEELVSAAQNCIKASFDKGESLTSSELTKTYFQVLIGSNEHEVFTVAWLNNQHEVIGHSELFRGTIDSAAVYPREVVKDGLAHNAAAAIFAHNHPSGTPEPSQADVSITRRLKEALALVDIRVLDHLIIGETTTSMAERGLI